MVFEKVREIICAQFDLDEEFLTLKSTLDEINADSLDVYDLVQSLEVEFDVEFHEEDFERIKTVQDIVSFIENDETF
jgi:acyl carrier protein